MEDKLASKQDVKELESRLEAKIQHAILQTESKLTLRMGAMFTATIAILTAIQKFT